MKRRFLAAFSVFAIVIALFGQTSGALAYSQTISGFVPGTGVYRFFDTARTMSNPDPTSSGWDIAYQNAGSPAGLYLAAWNCIVQNYWPWPTGVQQGVGVWRMVADPVSPSANFCIAAKTSTGAGNFSGTLAWD